MFSIQTALIAYLCRLMWKDVHVDYSKQVQLYQKNIVSSEELWFLTA